MNLFALFGKVVVLNTNYNRLSGCQYRKDHLKREASVYRKMENEEQVENFVFAISNLRFMKSNFAEFLKYLKIFFKY